ncbi:MAG: coiled-coil domain-containing protein, partial [Eubacterium sp.]
MKQSKLLIKLLSVLLAFCFVFSSSFPNYVIMAKDNEYTDNYDSMTDAQKQAYLEQKVKELNQKLDELGNQTGETEEYINTIDEKISYLQQELSLAKKTIENSQAQKKNLENQYENNEKEIAQLQQDIEQLALQEQELQSEFDKSYQQYSQRARALYISGGTNVLELLLTSDDISVLFTRLEMIKRVSMADKNLLKSLQDEGEKLLSTKASLEDKKNNLTTYQEKLIATKENLDETIKTLEAQQASYSQKEKSYEDEKAKADLLLVELHNETKTYSEFRNQDLEELNEINRQIEQAALEWQQKQEAATTTTTTTKKQTTTQNNNNSQSTTTTTTTTQKTTTSSSKLSMTYPVPSQTKITTAYGSAGYVGHTGVD